LLATDGAPTPLRVTDELAAQTNEVPSPGEAKRCACGHARGHHMVSADPEYSGWGWFLVLVGISATPHTVRFVCRRCEQVLETVTDRAALAAMGH
jgi:hypothetical protein